MSCKKILVNVEFNYLFRLANLLTFLFYFLLLGKPFCSPGGITNMHSAGDRNVKNAKAEIT